MGRRKRKNVHPPYSHVILSKKSRLIIEIPDLVVRKYRYIASLPYNHGMGKNTLLMPLFNLPLQIHWNCSRGFFSC
jgi:hypothetical protein